MHANEPRAVRIVCPVATGCWTRSTWATTAARHGPTPTSSACSPIPPLAHHLPAPRRASLCGRPVPRAGRASEPGLAPSRGVAQARGGHRRFGRSAMTGVDDALELFADGFECSQAVLGAYAPALGLDFASAMRLAAPFSAPLPRRPLRRPERRAHGGERGPPLGLRAARRTGRTARAHRRAERRVPRPFRLARLSRHRPLRPAYRRGHGRGARARPDRGTLHARDAGSGRAARAVSAGTRQQVGADGSGFPAGMPPPSAS